MAPTPKDLYAATNVQDERGGVRRGDPIPDDWPQAVRDSLYQSGGAVSKATWDKQAKVLRAAGVDV